MSTNETRLARAKRYPYGAPPWPYLFAGGRAWRLVGNGGPLAEAGVRIEGGRVIAAAALLRDLGAEGAAGMGARVAVIAHGSNAAPETLARKFAGLAPADAVIPVLRARLLDHDVVYAAHFSSYGAIPSTLAASPGTMTEVAVTLLDPDQLARMHASEMSAENYLYGRLAEGIIRVPGVGARVFAYLTRFGALSLAGAPLALATRRACGRRFAAAAKPAVLGLARDHLAPGQRLDRFILETIADAGLRRHRSEALRARAVPLDSPGFTVVSG